LKAATGADSGLSATTAGTAWLRTGQVYDLKRQRPQALEAYRRAVNIVPDSDVADQAKGYIFSRYKR